ncbi:MAG: DEAD/DEAH box helicase [Candidatus Bathyarchaeota archaeon]|nr:DEAD/DEAH box helicase [Candidatus Bathyarchaeota archaeon]MDH5733598.1 DEAD/DEAH box helicase [Candidatus Bathyarchaeota archaeon]
MTDRSGNAFGMLVKPIRRLIEQKGFQIPTEPQEKAMPKILEGKNVLLISPTATGKTEAAVLPVLNVLIQMPKRPLGIKVLYITPLRALNRDVLERLEWWCNNLDIKLAVRHGDTSVRERSRQSRSPPDMLITTPETLQAMIPGRILRQHLQQIRWVIVDEVHEMADSKRGSQLSLALERLRWITGREFQLIGLSATIGSPEKVAQFLVGNERPVEIVKVPVARLMKLKVLFPKPTSEDHELASSLFTHPEVATRLRIIRQLIEKQKSVLLFTNTRAVSEVLASRFKVWDSDFPVSIHHGSLAKPSRIAAERGLKNGKIKGLVATSSLELGIDVGRIDMVIQYMSPRQVTRLIQRVGRSGHRIGRIAKGLIITMDSDDTLEAMVIARMAEEEKLEPVDVPQKPYDVLAHQIIGLLMKKKRWYFYEIYDLFRKAYPYHNLSLHDIEKVLTYMHSRFPRFAWVSFEDMLAIKPRRTKAMYEYYFENLSMIPEVKQYLVVDEASDSAVGILDEAFVAEFGKPGTKFIIRGSPWKIINVYGDHIYVRPVDDPTGAIPSWIGEEIAVPFEVAQEVGWVRGFIEEQVKNGVVVEEIVAKLGERYPADTPTISRAIHETVDQVKKDYLIPTHKRILIEDWEDFVIIHANFGSLTNRAIGQLIGHIVSEQIGYTVAVQHDPYRIFIQTMGTTDANRILDLFNELKEMSDSTIQDLLTKTTVRTGLFKRRMVHVARRFGALKKWVDFSRVSLQKLVKSLEGTAIYDEALKEVFTKDLDLQHMVRVLDEVRKNEVEVTKLDTSGVATPVARVGIERVSMKTDLIPPERMRLILVETTRARLLNETRTFICANCWDYVEMIRIKDLPDKPTCPQCGSTTLGVLRKEEDEVYSLLEKKGEKLTKTEEKTTRVTQETGRLMSSYGKPAATALSARRLRISDVKRILNREKELSDRFFELIIEAERQALKRRF